METNAILDTSAAIGRNEGTITIFTVIEYPPSAKYNFDVVFPETLDYLKATEIATRLREVGKPIGAIDMIIAAMCLNRFVKLVTKDRDFEYVAELFPDFDVEFVRD